MMEKASLKTSNVLKCLISPQKRYIHKHLDIFLNYVKPKSKSQLIIDVGAGTSYYKHIFAEYSYNYISIDIKSSPNLSGIGTAQRLPFKSGIADAVLLIEVLEHIYDTKDVFKEINRVLRLHGYLFLTVPFVYGYHDSIDYFRFTETALEKLLNENGFEIVAIKKRGGIFACLNAIVFNIPSALFKSKMSYLLFIFLSPLIGLLFLLDYTNIDRNKNFTLGIDLLAIKMK